MRGRRKPVIPGIEYWRARPRSVRAEVVEVAAVLLAVTAVGAFLPFSYHVFGHIYLLVVIALSLRVGRWPALLAAVLSGAAWNFVFMAPRFSFSMDDFEEDVLLLGTYFAAALIGGQLAARIREEERRERQREQRATALFHLTRSLAAAQDLDAAVAAALHHADQLFDASTTLLWPDGAGRLTPHASGTLRLDAGQIGEAEEARTTGLVVHGEGGGRDGRSCVHLPLKRGAAIMGVFSVDLREPSAQLRSSQWDLLEGFAAQIALQIEREQLRAAAEREKLAAESDRLRRTLLDSVSHELKTPLAVLRTSLEKLETTDAVLRRTWLGEARTAMQRLDRLVGNLLNQTRLEAGAVQPQRDWCDLRDVIAAARRGVGDVLAGHHVEVAVPEDFPFVRIDAQLLEQVLINLLLNVARHTPVGSRVEIGASVREDRGKFSVEISDDGPGLPPSLRAQLFQKFKRGSDSGTGGVGLGLSIVHGFMLAQGGDVTVTSPPDGGTCFTLWLPHEEAELVPGDEP